MGRLGPLFSMLTGPSQTSSLVTLQYKDAEENPLTVGFADGCSYQIMPDWRILGTMNTMDKASLFRLSYAFSRRFAFIEVPPPSPVALDSLLRAAISVQMYMLGPLELHSFLMQVAASLQADAEVEVGAAVLIDMLRAIEAQLTDGGSLENESSLVASTVPIGAPSSSTVDGVHPTTGVGNTEEEIVPPSDVTGATSISVGANVSPEMVKAAITSQHPPPSRPCQVQEKTLSETESPFQIP